MRDNRRNTMIAFILGQYLMQGNNQLMLSAQLSRLLHYPDDMITQEFRRLGNTKVAYLWPAVLGFQRRLPLFYIGIETTPTER